MRNAYRILVGNLKGRELGRSRRRWEGNSRIYLKEVGWEYVDWILLAEDRD
jgi:hypothetical protein